MKNYLTIAKKVDRFYERYLFYDWSNSQGEYTMQNLADDLSIHLMVWIDDLTDILETFDPGSTGYQECISIIDDLRNL